MDEKPTAVGAIALPVEYVKLKHMKQINGEPVVVGCGSVDEVKVVEVMGILPGAHPKPSVLDEQPEPSASSDDPKSMLSEFEHIRRIGPGLIEAGTWFDDGKGGHVRPAFYWGDKPRHPLSIDGHLLRTEELVELTTAIMRVSGYLEGARETGNFPDGGPEHADVGGDAVADGIGNGPNAAGGVA